MHKARKAHGDKVILDDVTLSFFPGAKIGVVGPNGAGKSSVLQDHGRARHSRPTARRASARATRSASCMQEPQLNEAKTVLENVEEGVGRDQGQARPLQRDLRGDGRPRRRLRHAARRDGRAAGGHRPRRRLGPRLPARAGDGRAALPAAATPTSTVLSGGERRRVALCKLLLQKPDLLLLDEPTNHLDAESVQWLEQHLAKYPGAVLAVTHDRYFLDNVAAVDPRARPRPRLPVRGQLLDLPREEGRAPQGRGQEGRQARQAARATSSSGCGPTPRAGRPRRKARLARYEEMAAEAERTRKLDFEEIQIPPGPRLGNVVVEANEPDQGLRRPRAHRRPVVHPAARTASSASSARTASARPRCSR